MLREQIVNLEPNDARKDPELSITLFQTNQGLKFDDFTWRLSATAINVTCGQNQAELTFPERSFKGNVRAQDWNIETTRDDRERGTSYLSRSIIPQAIRPCNGPEVNWILGGSVKIPECKFDFATNPTCYPSVQISNHNTFTTEQITFQVTQGGDMLQNVRQGETAVVDRSRGDVEVRLEAVHAPFFAGVELALDLPRGPTISLQEGLSAKHRNDAYKRLAELKAQADITTRAFRDPLQSIRLKTLHSAAHILSAMAVLRRFPDHVKELLLSRAHDIQSADERVAQIRNLVIAVDALTPEQIDLLLVRIDLLLAEPGLMNRPSLTLIRDELVRARTAAAETATAVNLLRERFKGDIDRIAADFQNLILEYAQYVTNEELEDLLDPTARESIRARLSPKDIVIRDEMLSGRGAAVRHLTGLPEPIQ